MNIPDLIAVVIAVVVAIMVVITTNSPLLRLAVSIPFIFLLPGYVVVAAVFPRILLGLETLPYAR